MDLARKPSFDHQAWAIVGLASARSSCRSLELDDVHLLPGHLAVVPVSGIRGLDRVEHVALCAVYVWGRLSGQQTDQTMMVGIRPNQPAICMHFYVCVCMHSHAVALVRRGARKGCRERGVRARAPHGYARMHACMYAWRHPFSSGLSQALHGERQNKAARYH